MTETKEGKKCKNETEREKNRKQGKERYKMEVKLNKVIKRMNT
jgi:hypothetical protein